MRDVELGSVKIKLFLGEQGPYVALKQEGDLGLVQQLGMLELTKDTLLHNVREADDD